VLPGGDGSSAVLARSQLIQILELLSPSIAVIVFVAGSDRLDDPAVARLVDELDSGAVAAIRRVPAVNAAKRVRDGMVVEAVDRSTLNLLRTPEVVDRRALEAALDGLRDLGDHDNTEVVHPTRLVAAAGGRVAVVDLDAVADHAVDAGQGVGEV